MGDNNISVSGQGTLYLTLSTAWSFKVYLHNASNITATARQNDH